MVDVLRGPLRVAMVCPYSFDQPGGVQNHVIGLSGWLSRAGHEVYILGPGRPDPAWLARHGLNDSSVTSTGSALPVHYNGSVARLSFGPVTSGRVRRWLDDVAPDVIHVHEPITPSASVLAVWQRNAPVLATFHTATPGSRSMLLAGQVLVGTIEAIDAGIAVSGVAREVVRRHIGLDPVVIGNGIDLSSHTLRTVTGRWRGGSRPRVSFLGRLDEPRKGFDVFAEAMTLVQGTKPDVEVVVAGGGRPRSAEGLTFLGRVSDRERDQVLSTSDVYVAPHLGRESFGIVLLEALACGAQVVASDLPAFREVLTGVDGPVGRLVPVGSAQAVAAAVLAALEQPHDPSPGRARAAEFDWSSVAPQVVGHYRTLVYDEVRARGEARARWAEQRRATGRGEIA